MYIKTLNYSDTLKKVVEQKYSPRRYYMLNFEEKLEAVGEAHKIMREYVLKQKRNIKRSGLH